MRPILLIMLFAWALAAIPLLARVGETLDQCKKRYGKAASAPPPYDFGNEAKELVYYNFEKNGIIIQIGFLNGKAADLSFQHSPATPTEPGNTDTANAATGNGPPIPPLTKVEIDTLLAANAGGMEWKQVADGKLVFFPDGPTPTNRYGNYQQRDDGVLATIDGPSLHIFTPEWMDYINVKMKAHNERVIQDQKKNLEGF